MSNAPRYTNDPDGYRHTDNAPNFDLSKGWAPAYAVAVDNKELLSGTVQPTVEQCRQRTEFLLNRDLPPNYTIVPIALVFRKVRET